jgi:hypothetical protein
MSPPLLEKRVAAVEEELARLRIQLDAAGGAPWWQRIAGTFQDDPTHEKARKLGEQYRRSQGPDASDRE